MKDSIKIEAEKVNEIGYGSNNSEPSQMKKSSEKKNSEDDAPEAISEYINRSDCE